MSATSLDLSQIKTDALSAASTFRTLIGLGSGNTPTFLGATLTGGTVTASAPIIDGTQTWNSAGTVFTGMRLNVTDTASSSSSLLMDLQVGAVSRLSVRKTGLITSGAGIVSAGNSGLVFYGDGFRPRLRYAGVDTASLGNGVISLATLFGTTPVQFGWASGNVAADDTQPTMDLILTRDAAQTLAQRNAGNAQRFNLYGTYTDASNYRRLYLNSTTAGAFTLGVEGAGTGASGNTLTVGNDLSVPSLSTPFATLFNAPAGYHVFYDGQSVLGFVISHHNYDPDTAVFINSSRNVLSPQGVFAFGNGTYWQSDVVLKRTSANTISVLRGNFSTPGNFVSGTTSITPASLTGSSATSALDIAQTWNTTGIPTLIKANVTDTASNANSLLMNLQVGGSSRFNVTKAGRLAASGYGLASDAGFVRIDYADSTRIALFSPSQYQLQEQSWLIDRLTTSIDFSTLGTRGFRFSPTANVFEILRSTNAQTFRIYNTFTDASNYERLALSSSTYSSARYFSIAAESAGTGAADLNVVVSPRGTGAFMLHVPDGTSAGGNARGAYAVDLQRQRSAAADVASGSNSVICGGDRNSASGVRAIVTGGQGNYATGSDSFIGGGFGGFASGNHAFIGNGNSCQATATYAAVISSERAVADRRAMLAHSAGMFSASGDAQTGRFVARNKVSDNTLTELYLNGSSVRLTIPSGKIMGALVNVTATTSGGEFACQYIRHCVIRNQGGTTAMSGSVQTVGTDIEGFASCDLSIDADDTNDALRIRFQGTAPVTGCTAEADDDVISKTAHGFNNNDDIIFSSLTGGAGLTANTVTYWVRDATADTFKVSTTRGGAAVNITTDYSDMTATRMFRVVASIDAVEVGHGT